MQLSKQINFDPKQTQLEDGAIQKKHRKISKVIQTAWNKLLKPANNATAPFICMAVSTRTKKPKKPKKPSND